MNQTILDESHAQLPSDNILPEIQMEQNVIIQPDDVYSRCHANLLKSTEQNVTNHSLTPHKFHNFMFMFSLRL